MAVCCFTFTLHGSGSSNWTLYRCICSSSTFSSLPPRNTVNYWLTNHTDLSYADIETRPQHDQVLADLVFETHPGPGDVKAALPAVDYVEVIGDTTLAIDIVAFYDDLNPTSMNLSLCDHRDCRELSARYLVFPDLGLKKQYCSEHYQGAALLKDRVEHPR